MLDTTMISDMRRIRVVRTWRLSRVFFVDLAKSTFRHLKALESNCPIAELKKIK